MPADEQMPASAAPKAEPPKAADEAVEFECYCGLGTACPGFREMNASQRAACTCDKRQTAQWMYVNGMTE